MPTVLEQTDLPLVPAMAMRLLHYTTMHLLAIVMAMIVMALISHHREYHLFFWIYIGDYSNKYLHSMFNNQYFGRN